MNLTRKWEALYDPETSVGLALFRSRVSKSMHPDKAIRRRETVRAMYARLYKSPLSHCCLHTFYRHLVDGMAPEEAIKSKRPRSDVELVKFTWPGMKREHAA